MAVDTLELRHQLLTRLCDARRLTDDLFEIVQNEALYERPIPERHRIVFYIGHLEAFDWNLVCRGALGFKPFNETFDRLFAFGIDPVGGGLPADQPSDWPSLQEVHRYNGRVRAMVDGAVAAGLGDSSPPGWESPVPEPRTNALLHVALEHRLMHAETLAYMFHQLPAERKRTRKVAYDPAPMPQPRLVEIAAGSATLGRPRHPAQFGWDNEFEAIEVTVPAFAMDAYKVTNGQYLEFVRQGGYQEKSLWPDDDWSWITREGISHPRFWRACGDSWLYRRMFDEIPLPLEWPAYVSHAEASAYARWAKKRLPTEAQFHRAAYGCPEGAERPYPWGDQPPEAFRGNFDFRRWDPVAVHTMPAGDSAFGVAGLLGNGWEWTASLFEPFPGFEPMLFYPGYSANFFDGKHYVMKGGSARTAACLLRRSFRNWFQPRYPYVYAGFRCVSE